MSWSTSDIPDLTDSVAVVTGANGGLGLETAKALAGAGALVVMAARNQAKASVAESEILVAHSDALLEIVQLDLGSLESVRSAAEAIAARHDAIDILVNNAGLMAMPEGRTADGFETQFGVNHLGHFAFTARLLEPLLAADAARVVTVTSTAHHMGRPVDPDNPHLEGRYAPWRAYGQAKLANFHFGIGLNRRFESAGTTASSLVAHPGLSNTDLQSRTVAAGGGGPLGAISHRVAAGVGMSAADGALSQLRAATDPDAKGGEFYGPLWGNNGPPVQKPILRRFGMDRAIDTLWQVSERETGVPLDVAAIASG